MKRDTLILVGVALVAIAIGGYFFLSGDFQNTSSSALSESQPSAASVPFTPLARGARSTVTERVNYVITSPAQLSKLWKMVEATSTPPAIDFSKDAVIAVFAGKQPATGYAITVSKIIDSGKRVVSITIANPGSDCMLAQTITSPYEVVAVPATALPLTHEDVSVTTTCAN